MPSCPPPAPAGEGSSRGSLASTPWSLAALDIPLGWLMLLLCLLSGVHVSLNDAVLTISPPWFARYIQVLAAALVSLSLQSPKGNHLPPRLSGLPGLRRDFLLRFVLPRDFSDAEFPTGSLCQVHAAVLAQLMSRDAHIYLSFPSGWTKWSALMIWAYAHSAFNPAPLLVCVGLGQLLALAGALNLLSPSGQGAQSGCDRVSCTSSRSGFWVRSCKSFLCLSRLYFGC